eukprot:3702409-Rhodomonas_salina.3
MDSAAAGMRSQKQEGETKEGGANDERAHYPIRATLLSDVLGCGGGEINGFSSVRQICLKKTL